MPFAILLQQGTGLGAASKDANLDVGSHALSISGHPFHFNKKLVDNGDFGSPVTGSCDFVGHDVIDVPPRLPIDDLRS
jgi:hypothetical protein